MEQFSGRLSKVLKIPDVALSRMNQIKVAVMLALSSNLIEQGDKIVCVTGVMALGVNDTVVVIDTGIEFEIFSSANLVDISTMVRPDVFETVLKLAMELATQGREGRAVGTIFVLGDDEKVLQLSRQMIINPFKGYSEDELSVHAPELREAIKEFSVIDGAFIIRGDGVLLTAGRHLNAAVEGENLPQGLGSRHMAAAGITSFTDSIAIVISESTGSVRIFKKGNIFMEIERLSIGPWR
jgi:DNA integrity scanning protein DisA with diadenylate cyclase activity